ncbi:MAG: alanine racemase [Actinomycetota bacterium]|nr:alanine racemase [Actinomycetota bacterium]
MEEPSMPFPVPEGLVTPSVVVDVDALDRNVTTWAAALADRGVGLRPHTKTSKCLEVVERQVAAGVVGLTVATLGEAEVLADAGHTDLFVAYPTWAGHPAMARRLRDLHERSDLLIGVESTRSARALAAAVDGSARRLGVLVEVDAGMRRTGVEPAEVVAIARSAEQAGLEVRGVFTFAGHGYGAAGAPDDAADDEVRVLADARARLSAAGFEVPVCSAGSTPTAMRSARPPVTDERPGCYVFGDAQQVTLGAMALGEVALVVAATVVASHRDGRFVLDAGSKVLAADRPAWVGGHGLLPDHPGAELRSLSEHHGVAWTTGPRPEVGDVVAVVPNHCCVVVNLVDELTVARHGEVVDHWRVAARGRNT